MIQSALSHRALVVATMFALALAPSPARAQSPAPNLSVSMIDAPDPVAPGKILTYRISVGLAGRRSVPNVSVRTEVPAGTTFVAFHGPAVGWTPSFPSAGGSGPVSATTATFPAGRVAVFQLSVRVSPDLQVGSTLSNLVTISTPGGDPNPDDDSATAITVVRPAPPPTADLSVALSFLQEPVPAFGQLVERAIVRNDGPMAATDVEIHVPTPQSTTFSEAAATAGTIVAPAAGASGDVVAHVDAIPAGRIVVLTVVSRVMVDAGARIVVGASVDASSTDPNSSNDTDRQMARVVPAGPIADLSIAFPNPPDHVVADGQIVYTAVVTNLGPTPVDEVAAVVPVPSNTRFLSATTDVGTLITPPRGRPGPVGWRPGALAPGASASVTITARVGSRAGVPVAGRAIVTSRATDLTLDNNTATISTRVQSLGDSVVSWDPPEAGPGVAAAPTNLVVDPRALGASAAKTSIARDDVVAPLCYNVYVSSSPNVVASPENLFTTVPANQTTTTVPVAPGGSFFTVTAEYPTGESGGSNVDGDGTMPGATVTNVTVSSGKLVGKGSGFSDPVEVLVDGIPFDTAAKVKGGGTKTVQKGGLLIGVDLETYLSTGASFLMVFRNDDGGVTVWEYSDE